jgi:hypothetical protein
MFLNTLIQYYVVLVKLGIFKIQAGNSFLVGFSVGTLNGWFKLMLHNNKRGTPPSMRA